MVIRVTGRRLKTTSASGRNVYQFVEVTGEVFASDFLIFGVLDLRGSCKKNVFQEYLKFQLIGNYFIIGTAKNFEQSLIIFSLSIRKHRFVVDVF